MTLLWVNRATTFSLRFSRGAVTVAKLPLADIIEIFSVEAAGEWFSATDGEEREGSLT